MTETMQKVIVRLKEVKDQKKLSCQNIVDLCDQNGESVSPSTVRRIFAKGSENSTSGFRSYSVDAIFRAVVGTEEVELSPAEEAALTDAGKEFASENAALKAIVELRDRTIEELQSEIQQLRQANATLEEVVREKQIRIETMSDVIRLAVGSIGESVTR